MTSVNLNSLVGKLNDTCRKALEGAVALCLTQTHYNVEIEHWFLKLLEASDGDLPRILRQYNIDAARLARDLTASTERFKTGNSRTPAISLHVVDLAREGWLAASVQFNEQRVRSGHLLYALVANESLAPMSREASREFARLEPEALRRDLPALVAGSAETKEQPSATPAAGGAAGPVSTPGKTTALDQYTIDLTQKACAGQIDPVLGRDREIEQVMDILTRRRQNNPILTGEAGVGKTAVVEGFALRIAAGDVPPALQNVALRQLDLGLLQAGAGVRGEFENRLKNVIAEVKASPRPVVLFIDEAHTMIGAGGQEGQGDAANLLKPALARGELRTIAATTWAEYKKYFEKDAALARRFQVVKVDEPSEPVAEEMLRGLVQLLEGHHKVRILAEAVREAVRLSHRFLQGRQLPDKAVSVLDTACARVAISHTAVPPALQDCRRRIARLDTTAGLLRREDAAGADHRQRLDELARERAAAEAEQKTLEARWQEELRGVRRYQEVRGQLEALAAPAGGQRSVADTERLRAELAALESQLRGLQGETPLVHVGVDAQTIAGVVSAWTGIPVRRMVADEINTLLTLRQRLEERIIGQAHALEAVTQCVRTARANLTDPRKPIGVFLLVGPSGVGKTETALALADLLYGGDQNMTVINMSEFKEEHKVSLLMGSPPGYVGYGEGGVLTEAVRRRPYGVVLLDEMEKAHPGVQHVFYQVFDKGTLRDGEGRDIDFKNTLILMTSNAASDTVLKLCADPETRPDPERLAELMRGELLKVFQAPFLGRVQVVPYFPLTDEALNTIIALHLGRIGRRVAEHYRARFTYAPELVAHLKARCQEVDTGARNIDHILTRGLLPELATAFLARLAHAQPVTAIHVSIDGNGAFTYDIS